MPSLTNEMSKLKSMLLTMGSEVEQRVGGAVEAIVQHDLATAKQVRYGDDAIDEMDLSVEAECVEILALHQPVAGDLRYILATLRINTELERMADLARSVARRAIKLEKRTQVERPPVLADMACEVRSIVGDAIRALGDQDEVLCERIRRSDATIDAKYKAVFTWAAMEVQAHGEGAQAVIDILSMVRALERIADISVNIAEAVIFSIGGTIVRHTSVDE